MKGWREENGCLKKTFVFKDFVESLSFVVKVGMVAERIGHHPDITINYNKVSLSLTTHDAGGITEKDHELAKIIDELL